MGDSGSLEKMVIIAYEKNDFKGEIGQIAVHINPEKYSRNYEICYNDVQAQGSSSGTPEYNRTQSDKVEFELVFDGTGVIASDLPGVEPFSEDGITDQIDEFLGLIFTYNGSIHSPNYLKLSWGKLLFKCRLSSLNLTYTLFKPDGTPLRARADCSFVEFTNPVELAEEENKSSPDVTHVVTVRAGDTLPLLCYGIYGSSVYYPQVAAVNGLTDFRELAIGDQLLFPPLEDAVS